MKVEAPPTSAEDLAAARAGRRSLVLFGGLNGHFLLEELARGAVGTMPGCDMTDAFVGSGMRGPAGDLATARVASRLLPLIRYELQPGFGVAVMKQNLYDAGIIASPRVRHPTRTLDATDIAEVRAHPRRSRSARVSLGPARA